MFSVLARSLRPIIPAPIYRSIQMHVSRRVANRWLAREGVLALALQVAQRFDYRVQSGPFAGLKYSRSAVLTRHATPALLGTYERQIYPFLEAAAKRCDFVIDVGSAEGYYALGMALRGKRVVAFDADPHERRVLREMAAANQLSDRVTIEPWCTPSKLIEIVGGQSRTLIISDIDGGELDLFTPEVVAAIKGCDLIIELHGKDAEANLAFIKRFDGSVQILNHPAEPAEPERLAFLGADAARMAAEYRPHQQWLLRPADAVREDNPAAAQTALRNANPQ
jgi:hypothetical protein